MAVAVTVAFASAVLMVVSVPSDSWPLSHRRYASATSTGSAMHR